MDSLRTVTLETIDHGPVTFDCPSWCIGHAWQVGAGIGRNDITHNSVRVKAGVDTESHGWLPLMNAWVTWAPFVELVPVVAVELSVQADFPAEDVTHLMSGLDTVQRRLAVVAAEAIRLRGEIT
ncbi:DUF6907 domain-containing protein [Streptomyces sp. MN13]